MYNFDSNNDWEPKLLAQVLPDGTSPVTGYAPASNRLALITHIHICNTGTADSAFSVYVDVDGTDSSDINALVKDKTLKANDFDYIPGLEFANLRLTSQGQISVESGTANKVGFHIFGYEKSL